MDHLVINFVPRARLSLNSAGAALLLVGLLALVVVARFSSAEESRHQLALDRQARLAKQAKGEAISNSAALPVNSDALKQAGLVLDTLSVPWDDLFTTIEATDVTGLGLLTLSPDPRSGNLHISGEGRSLDDVLAYVARLTDQPRFRDVNLVSYETVQRDGQNAVQFNVVAKWK